MSDTESDSSIHTPPKKLITVEKLMTILKEMIEKNPEAKNAVVYRLDYGSVKKVRFVELETVMNSREVKPFLVLD